MSAAEKIEEASFQSQVQPWMTACFGPEISGDRLERADRLLEEVLELLQSGDYPRERVAALTGYVWSRQKGEPAQEVGGVMVTLAAYCLAHGLDMHEAGKTELARIWTKVEKIRAKQAAKPTGSALPQVWPEADVADALAQENERLRSKLARYAIHEEYDFPGDAPEFCGWLCSICGEHVKENGCGHLSDCVINGHNPAGDPAPSPEPAP